MVHGLACSVEFMDALVGVAGGIVAESHSRFLSGFPNFASTSITLCMKHTKTMNHFHE